MSIGYACLIVGIPGTKMSRVMKKNATPEKLTEVTLANLQAFEKMIDYNIENDIHLFRISSDIIPFGSSPVNQLPWWEIFQEHFERIGNKIKNSKMRVSFHPGQYTVLNSPNEETVARAIEDLRYHTKVLECLGLNQEHKIVLHIGGVYEDKKEASLRFIERYQQLDEAIKQRLIIENDDRLYNIQDVLWIAQKTGAPVVYDNLHHNVNPGPDKGTDEKWITEASKTWKKEDGKQKIHYSQQALDKRLGAHTATTYLEPFLEFYHQLPDKEIDIMLEVKDKNLSAVKCIQATSTEASINHLEKEWAKYKYLVLEHNPGIYQQIRQLLKDKTSFPVIEFYDRIEEAVETEVELGNALNAAQHIWGHLKEKATEKESKAFERKLATVKDEKATIKSLKNQLMKLTQQYEDQYLEHSLYFYME